MSQLDGKIGIIDRVHLSSLYSLSKKVFYVFKTALLSERFSYDDLKKVESFINDLEKIVNNYKKEQ